MTEMELTRCEMLCREFMERVKRLRLAEKKKTGEKYITDYFNSPKEQGSVKRCSMDLSRALADLRGRNR